MYVGRPNYVSRHIERQENTHREIFIKNTCTPQNKHRQTTKKHKFSSTEATSQLYVTGSSRQYLKILQQCLLNILLAEWESY